MLSMYLGMGCRREFEVIARRLHDDFNLGMIRWEADEDVDVPKAEGRGCLEAYPHIIENISARWERPECLEYLNSLLEDNRAGIRSGFTLGAFEELLLLAELAEARQPPLSPVVREDKAENAASNSAAGQVVRAALTGAGAVLLRLQVQQSKTPIAHG